MCAGRVNVAGGKRKEERGRGWSDPSGNLRLSDALESNDDDWAMRVSDSGPWDTSAGSQQAAKAV